MGTKGTTFPLVLLVAFVAVFPVRARQSSPPDPAALVAAARQALGGDAALSAIASLTISGSYSQELSSISMASASFESSWVSPDKFLRVSRRYLGGGGPLPSYQITEYKGFNGDVVINRTDSGAPFPVAYNPSSPRTPEEVAAAQARRLQAARNDFFEALIPLLITPPGPWGLQVAYVGLGEIDGGKVQVHALDIKPIDGRSFRLLLDAKTSLPVRLTWIAKPIVTTSTTSMATTQTVVRTPAGAGPPNVATMPPPILPSGDPTIGLADVQWNMAIGDYKVADGLNWPRRLRTTYGDKKWQDFRISRYRINPKIDPKIFDRKN